MQRSRNALTMPSMPSEVSTNEVEIEIKVMIEKLTAAGVEAPKIFMALLNVGVSLGVPLIGQQGVAELLIAMADELES
jgi:hypothetical protein